MLKFETDYALMLPIVVKTLRNVVSHRVLDKRYYNNKKHTI